MHAQLDIPSELYQWSVKLSHSQTTPLQIQFCEGGSLKQYHRRVALYYYVTGYIIGVVSRKTKARMILSARE